MQTEFNAGRQQCLRYRECSGIASATADLLASPLGDENLQRPLPRLSATQLPLPRIITGHKAISDLFPAGIFSIHLQSFGALVGQMVSPLGLVRVTVRGRPVHGNDALRRDLDKYLWVANGDTGIVCEIGIHTSRYRGLGDKPVVSSNSRHLTEHTHRMGIVWLGQKSGCGDVLSMRLVEGRLLF